MQSSILLLGFPKSKKKEKILGNFDKNLSTLFQSVEASYRLLSPAPTKAICLLVAKQFSNSLFIVFQPANA